MDPSISKRTQDTLGKVIKKPPLTEKLLSKPPFRFLHDIITEVIKNTGFMKGLYTADEMNSSNVKDKEAKIAFLQKAIDVVGMFSGQLSVRPSKIVAGHEPEKTNEFLQALGIAVVGKKSSADAVKRVLAGEKPGRDAGDSKRKESRSGNGSKERERSKERDKGKDKETDRSKEREKENEKDRDRERDSGNAKREREEKDRRRQGDFAKRKDSSSKTESSEKRRQGDSAKREREKERSSDKPSEKGREKEKPSRKEEDSIDDLDGGAGVIDGELESEEIPPNRIPRPSSAKGQRRRPTGDDGDDVQEMESDEQAKPSEQMNGVLNENELPPQVMKSRARPRPSSARPAPPKIKKQQDDLEDQSARISSGKQVSSVIVDDGKDQDDEDDTFVVEDTHPIHDDLDMAPAGDGTENDGAHGSLVRKILETKKEFEESGNQETKPRQERQTPIMSDAARRKERELAQKEIEKLRSSIQTLTRSANPLGKIMDYVQEDMDSMQKELDLWRRENKEHEVALKREESITESEVAPLRSELEELETEIAEMVDRISTVKCNNLRNDEKIQKMLSSISTSSR